MLAAIRAATLFGVEGRQVTVEVHVSTGLPGFQMVGLPDEACRESRDRVRAALLSSGLPWPATRITVNLAPSDRRKGGSGLDLAIAVGLLVASGQIPAERAEHLGFLGELGLDGSVRSVAGVAPMVAALGDARAVVPVSSYREARAVCAGEVQVAANLADLVAALQGLRPWPDPPVDVETDDEEPLPDLADVRGQSAARFALEVAAAGEHHVLMVGSPGSGKTMLAQRLTGLLPPLDSARALEATMVHSAAGVRLPATGVIRRAPFRAPHHSSSMVSLVGGGSTNVRPGEISLAHGGVLFLDELGEFTPAVLDGLRQPLEEGVIRISRARATACLPARFLLVAATNPCPCGGGPPGSCECDDTARLRYLRRLSGPLLDRFDLRVAVDRPEVDDLLQIGGGESSAAVAVRVAAARDVAHDRAGVSNARLSGDLLDRTAVLSAPAKDLLRQELEANRLTGRGYHRLRRVARTVADLMGDVEHVVHEHHVAMAMQLRVRLGSAVRGRAA